MSGRYLPFIGIPCCIRTLHERPVPYRQRALYAGRYRCRRRHAGADPGDRLQNRLQRRARPPRRSLDHRQPLQCRALPLRRAAEHGRDAARPRTRRDDIAADPRGGAPRYAGPGDLPRHPGTERRARRHLASADLRDARPLQPPPAARADEPGRALRTGARGAIGGRRAPCRTRRRRRDHGQLAARPRDRPARRPICSVEAVAPDGQIEGVSLPRARFVIGVQWHPEYKALENPFSRALFMAFAQACHATDTGDASKRRAA